MYKYLRVYQLEWENLTAFLSGFLFNLLFYPIQLLVLFFLWAFIFESGNLTEIGSFTFELIVLYFVIQKILEKVLYTTDVSGQIEKEILGDSRTSLTIFICRPVDYTSYNLSKTLAPITLHTILGLSFLFLIGLFYPPLLNVSMQIDKMVVFLFLLVIAVILSFLIYSILGYLTFWLKFSPNWFYYMFMQIVAGSLIPLSLFPTNIYGILKILPTAYIFYLPIAVLIGVENLTVEFFLIGLLWIVILAILTKSLWLLGLKKYEAFGG